MKNKHFISWSLENVDLEKVPDDVLMAHIRVIAHWLDKELQYSESVKVNLSESRLTPLTARLEAANRRFEGAKPDLKWANYIHEAYRNALSNNFTVSKSPKPNIGFNESDFNLLLTTRRSVRAFNDEAIPDDLLKKIVGYGLWAPSNCNVQAVRYIVVKDPKIRKSLEINAFTKEMGYCTLVVVADYRFYPDGDIDSPIHDCAAAIQNILLACHYYGIGACYISEQSLNIPERRKALGIHNDYEKITAFLWMGQYDEASAAPARRKLEEVLEVK